MTKEQVLAALKKQGITDLDGLAQKATEHVGPGVTADAVNVLSWTSGRGSGSIGGGGGNISGSGDRGFLVKTT